MFTENQIYENLKLSLQKAEEALELGNYPIGSVIVDSNNKQLSIEMNKCTTNSDITAHAEIVGLRSLGNKINKYTPENHYLFTSLEPCFGCSFFIARSNIRQIYSALKDPHKGGTSDLKQQDQFKDFFEKIELINAPFKDLEEKSKELMKKYFLSISNIDAARYYGFSG
jgi:tRNA(adenine34) deaminase